jgi:hypothetical protein
MAISGAQPAYSMAQGGVMRGGSSRGNVHSTKVFVAIGGVHYATGRAVDAQRVLDDTLSISETEGATPNTAAFQVQGFQPTDGQDVVLTMGSKNNLDRLFAGTILTDAHGYVDTPANYNDHVNVIDYTWQLTRRTITQRWQTTSATVIAQAIIAACPGFSSRSVAAGLPVLDEFTVTDQTLASALSALCDRIGGYWKTTYRSTIAGMRADVRLGLTTDTSQTDPTTLTVAAALLTGMENFSVTRDLSQVITRQPVEGGGGTALVDTAPGATVLPVSDALWYNALGGLVASGPQKLAYTGLGLGYTPVVNDWHTQTGPIAARNWDGLAWSPTLSLFVAVASDVTPAIMTSPDGITWTSRTEPVSSAWRAVTWATGLNLFVAVSTAGLVMTSPDGITWTQRTAAAANGWEAIVWAPALSLLVVVGGSGASRVMTSPDGITWTARTAAAALLWQGVTWSPALGLLAACAFSAPNGIMTSPDGITWTQRTAPNSAYEAIDWSPKLGLFVAVGGASGVGVVLTSPDGITWTARVAANGNSWEDVIWVADLGLFLAVASDGVSNAANRIMASPDGISWTGYGTPAVGSWYALAWAPSLARLAAVGFVTGTTIQVMTSQALTYRTLTGIPASGVGSILYTIKAGDPVNLRVVLDDLAAQAVITALMLPTVDDGIIEGQVLQDGRISETEARARGTAQLALRSAIDVAITYDTRDKNTHAMRTIGVNLAAPTSVVASFKLQQVTIDTFHPALWPTCHAHGANKRFTLQDLLRVARGA